MNPKEKQIRYTDDLYKFKKIEGNRDINPSHLAKLTESIKENNLLRSQPIPVSPSFGVIDGQHRLQAAKDLKLGIYYFIVDDFKLEDIKRLNSNMRTWSLDDYLNAYISQGNKNYITYKKYLDQYQTSHSILMSIFTGSFNSRNSGIFKSGELEIDTEDEVFAIKILNHLKEIKQYFELAESRNFGLAIYKIMKEIEEYNPSKMVRQIRLQAGKLKPMVKTIGYIRLLEEIYNYNQKSTIRFF